MIYEYLPCPFCGNEDIYIAVGSTHVAIAECTECGVTLQIQFECDDEDECYLAIVKAWNHRENY